MNWIKKADAGKRCWNCNDPLPEDSSSDCCDSCKRQMKQEEHEGEETE